jgi:hypothetical protein
MTSYRLLFSVIALLFSAATVSAVGAEVDKSFVLRFGILSEPKPRIFEMREETTAIPRYYIPTGFRFGYLIWEKNGKPFLLETVTYPPSPPEKLGKAYKNQDPKKGLRSGQRELNGKGASGFGFDPGDPTGLWKMEFYVDGKLFRSIEFTVYEPSEKKKPN